MSPTPPDYYYSNILLVAHPILQPLAILERFSSDSRDTGTTCTVAVYVWGRRNTARDNAILNA